MGIIIGGVSPQDLILDGQSVALYIGGSPPVKVWPTSEVHEVSLTNKAGENTAHPLVTVTVPAGETWSVRVQGTMQSTFSNFAGHPKIRIGSSTSSAYGNNANVDYSGTITSANRTIAMVTTAPSFIGTAGFTGTVTIEK